MAQESLVDILGRSVNISNGALRAEFEMKNVTPTANTLPPGAGEPPSLDTTLGRPQGAAAANTGLRRSQRIAAATNTNTRSGRPAPVYPSNAPATPDAESLPPVEFDHSTVPQPGQGSALGKPLSIRVSARRARNLRHFVPAQEISVG